MALLFPTAQEMDGRQDDERTSPWRTWDAAWPEFPFRSTRLNKLVVHDVLIDLATELLGTEDIRLYLALLSAKYAHQSSGYNQLLHTDYPNHSLVVPRADVGYQHLETFIYLNDVSARNGATRLVSRTKTEHIPVEQHTLNLDDYGASLRRARAKRRDRPDRWWPTAPTSITARWTWTSRARPGSCCTWPTGRRASTGSATRPGPSRGSPRSGTNSWPRPACGN